MSITITLKTLQNKKYDLVVEESTTVLALKTRIEQELSLGEVAEQKLIRAGKILKDEQTLAESGVKDKEFIVVMVTKAKAPAKAEESAPAAAAPAPAQQPASQAPAPVSVPAPAQVPAPAVVQNAASQVVVNAEEVNSAVAQLMAMGFEHDQVVRALRAAYNNPERAADYLLNGIPDVPEAPARAPERGNAPAAGGNPMAALAQNPQMLAALLQQMPPELLQQMAQQMGAGGAGGQQQMMQMLQNPQMMQALMGMMAGAGGAPGGDMEMADNVIQVTEEEKASLDRLEAMGFSRHRAVEAFLACDRNEDLALNYLLDNVDGGSDEQGFEDGDDDMEDEQGHYH